MLSKVFKLSFCFLLVFIGIKCEAQHANQSKPLTGAGITYQIIEVQGGTYGYDIFDGEKRIIHQMNIPGQPGTKGFKSKHDCEKVAKLVVNKIRNGQALPTVTTEELKALGVIN